ncbi:adenylosuccinate lyase [candidate division WOR-3 bacterium]|nr:adenylosuccinate lyase [candidate division WOR-3 bacterium]MCK4526680.1 adenylosuccinate lyase [candidate division WOR-3 bacterium]
MIERYRVKDVHNIWTDKNKFAKWFEVELAVLHAREQIGDIPKGITKELRKTEFSLDRIKEIEKETHHDVIAFLRAIGENSGDESRFLHQGLTSSDVVDTACALQIKEVSLIISKELDTILRILKERALKFKGTLMVGRTHGVHAEPISLGLKILSWYAEMKRAKERFDYARETLRYGKLSGAVGNFAHLNPEIEEIALKKLGLEPEPVSTQIVPRDRYAEYQFSITMIGAAIERIAQEIRHSQRTEIRELEEPFQKGQTGSSAMPHKRNPIICERLCGMSRLLRGYLITSLENIPLWNERDISHSSTERIYLSDATELIVYMMRKLSFVIENFNVYPENLMRNIWLTKGLIFSQNVLISLLDKGMDRGEAYKIVQENAMTSWKEGGDFKESLKNDRRLSNIFTAEELDSLFEPELFLKNEDLIYKRVLE